MLSIWSLLLISACIFGSYCHSRYSKGLNRFKGPFLASFTDFWRLWQAFWHYDEIPYLDWRAAYGEIIRLGPNLLIFTNPSCVKTIYCSGFEKSDQYMVSAGVSEGQVVPNIFSTLDEKWHGQLRRSVGSAYSFTSILQYEPLIDLTVVTFLNKLDSLFAVQTAVQSFDLSLWLQYLTFDVICRLSYGTTFGILESDGKEDTEVHNVLNFFRYVNIVSCVPKLDWCLKKNPILLLLGRLGLHSQATATVPFARKQLMARLEEKKSTQSCFKERQVDILEKLLEAQKSKLDIINPKALLGLSLSSINAGSDIVGTAISSILYYMMKHPSAMERAVRELDEKYPLVHQEGSLENNMTSYTDAKSLRYLDACVKEALRLHPPAAGALFERVIPAQGATISGSFVPAGTRVSVLAYLMHRHKPTFGDDADEYRPERWLSTEPVEEARIAAMERAMYVFGEGPHTCLGRQIALLEIYKIVPAILRSFDLRLCNPSTEPKISNNVIMSFQDLDVVIERRK